MSLKKIVFVGFFFFFIACEAQATKALHDINGHTISLSSLKGKWVFINYWASWCQPCMDEIPELNAFYKAYASDKVAVYGVNYDGLPIHAQKKLVKDAGILYPNLYDPGRVLGLGDIRGVPATFVFNPQGKLIETLYGAQTVSSLKQQFIP